MKSVCLGAVLLFVYLTSIAQDTLQSTIVLIGDAGQLIKGRAPVISAVKKAIPFNNKTTIVFLGDNLYKTGLPEDVNPIYTRLKAALDSQILIAKGTDAKVYFMPGNHDWQNGAQRGYDYIVRQQLYVDNSGEKNVTFYPKDGCPGPVEVPITPDVVLLIMDSQWWVHPYDKPGIESDCPYKTKEEVLTQFEDILAKNSKKLVIIAFHHTLRSFGIHGGYFTLKQHIFPFTDAYKNAYIPLPFIGTIYPVTRGVFGTAEDLKHPFYQELIARMNDVIKGHQNVVFAAGHEHSLQLIRDTGYYYIVSGAGSKHTRVSPNKNKLFSSGNYGFATLEVSKNKNVRVNFYTVDSSAATHRYSKDLFNFSTLPTPENPQDTQRQVEYVFKDSVVISASDKYKNPSGFRKLILGENYRNVWSTPIRLKEFNLRKEKGGFTIVSMGGGKQTKSLLLKDRTGNEWVLRSVDKDPEKAIPENLRNTIARDIAQDLISSDYPYAPLIAWNLAKATGVVTASPEFFFVPDDPALGFYRPVFARTVCVLERREPTPDNSATRSSAKVIERIFDDNDHNVDQKEVLKARLLDNLIGDWDRHSDQWRWGIMDTGKGRTYYPIPRDRDQAFFNSDGLLISYFSRNQFPFLQGFKRNFASPKWLNYQSRDFDRFFLNQLDENDWRIITDSFVTNLPDRVIAGSVQQLPPEIYALSGQKIAGVLKNRRDGLKKAAQQYYSYLSKDVNVVGSNEVEHFSVKQAGNGDISVTVRGQTKASDSGFVMYNRIFKAGKTREIRLYGLNGNDRFTVDNGVTSKIKLRIIGGKGTDSFNIAGNIKNHIYDLPVEKNIVEQSRRSSIHFTDDPEVNNYRSTGFNYNVFRFPLINVAYNIDDRLLVGFGFSARTYGFRKDVFSTSHRLSTLYALSSGAYQLKYQGIFNSILGKNDIVVNTEFMDPTLNNFFGFGNNTKKMPGRSFDFFRVRYKYVMADVLLRSRLNDVVNVSIGPSWYHYWNKYENNKNRILGSPALIALDSADIFSVKDYVGGKLKIDINYINNEFFPTRGVLWNTELVALASVNKNNHPITRLVSDMQVYAPLREPDKVIAVVRMGGGQIFSENFEYFQALTLGANNFVRGYRKNRFSGSASLYGSFELRVKLFKSQSYILPGNVGLIGFTDVGRVWLKGEDSKKWHPSYGGGFYFAPFNLFLVSATLGMSAEDNVFNFSLGSKFNLTY